MLLTILGAMAMMSDAVKFDPKPSPGKKEWKPKFTASELEEMRSLPKRQRELKVRELRAKYLKERDV